MDDEADIGFVDAHAKGDGGDYDRRFPLGTSPGVSLNLLVEARVIGAGLECRAWPAVPPGLSTLAREPE